MNTCFLLCYTTRTQQSSSDLTTLTQVMCTTFVEFYPVFRRRNISQQQPQSPPLPQLLPPHPPTPYQPGYPQQVHLPYPTGEVLTMHLHCHTCSLKPRLSSPAFCLAKIQFFSKAARQNPEWKAWLKANTFTCTYICVTPRRSGGPCPLNR